MNLRSTNNRALMRRETSTSDIIRFATEEQGSQWSSSQGGAVPGLGHYVRRSAGAVARGWGWLIATGLTLAVLAATASMIRAKYTATVKLIRNPAPEVLNSSLGGENFKAWSPSPQTVLETVKSPQVLRRVVDRASLVITPSDVNDNLTVKNGRGTDFVHLEFGWPIPDQAVLLANLCAEEAADALRQIQVEEFKRLNSSIQQQLRFVDAGLAAAGRSLIESQTGGGADCDIPEDLLKTLVALDQKTRDAVLQLQTIDLQVKNLAQEISKLNPVLLAAKEALAKALERFTEEHPKVKELRAALAEAEAETAKWTERENTYSGGWSNPLANSLYQQVVDLRTRRVGVVKQLEEIKSTKQRLLEATAAPPAEQLARGKASLEYERLKSWRTRLAALQQQYQVLADNAVGSFRVFQKISITDLDPREKMKTALGRAGSAGLLGVLASALVLAIAGLFDDRIRSERDLRLATDLPLLARLENVMEMSDAERRAWAVRTLAVLRGRLTTQNNEALVCGFTSACSGEGRSTWIRLLGETASRLGYRVLIASEGPDEPNAKSGGTTTKARDTEDADDSSSEPGAMPLAFVSPLAMISYADWVWDLERRQSWQELLRTCACMENSVVLVDLPPLSKPEGILLAENLPNLIWLCAKDMADISETRAHVEALRHSRTNLAGAVFNLRT